jgi:hypothetical protein
VARSREEQYQALDRYATNLFYGAGPERPRDNWSTGNFGATYSNGQARPVLGVSPLPANRPVARVQPVNNGSPAARAGNENWSGDAVAFSIETEDLRNGSSQGAEAVRPAMATSRPASRGNASGPTYSDDFRRTLDALLNGPSTVC